MLNSVIAGEALFVGAGNFIIYKIVKKWFPQNEGMQLFVSGVMFHLLAEYSGLNHYYINYKTEDRRTNGQEKIDTNSIKPCLPTRSSIQDYSPSYSVLDYSATTTQACEPYRVI